MTFFLTPNMAQVELELTFHAVEMYLGIYFIDATIKQNVKV